MYDAAGHVKTAHKRLKLLTDKFTPGLLTAVIERPFLITHSDTNGNPTASFAKRVRRRRRLICGARLPPMLNRRE